MHPTIKTTILLALVLSLSILTITGQQSDYSSIKVEAERLYASGSYARANELYSKIDKTGLSTAESRWVDFRVADTMWRSQNATETADSTKFDEAQKQLEELIRLTDKENERDLIWSEAHESLGDLFWTRRNQPNWGGAWPHYQQALDWWAGQRNLDRARDRYLRIIFKAADPPRPNEYYYYTYYGNYIPLDTLENALKISQRDAEKAHLHFLVAMTMRYAGGDWELRQRVPEEFEAALRAGKKTDWYDDALFHYADWMNTAGLVTQTLDGQWQQQPDYVKALELYRRIMNEYAKGETRYYDQARDQIRNITQLSINVSVSNIFLPGSEVQFVLSGRNLRRTDLALYKIDLTRDVRFTRDPEQDEGEGEDGNATWLKTIRVAGSMPIKTWSEVLNDKGDHRPVTKELRIEGKLAPGAYLLEAQKRHKHGT